MTQEPELPGGRDGSTVYGELSAGGRTELSGTRARERTLGDLLLVAWRSRGLVAVVAVACGLCGLLFGLLRERKYEATVLLMPPSGGGAPGLLAQLSAENPLVMSLASSLGGGSSSPRMYTEILGSRRVRESVATRLGLSEVYGTDTVYVAAAVLKKRAKRSVTRGGLISVVVVDCSPERAAEIANAFADELNGLLGELNVTQASLELVFLKERLEKARGDLGRAEEALRDFQQENKAIDPTGITRAGIDIYAELKAVLIAQETRLNVVRTYRAAQSPEVEALSSEVRALREQLAALEAPRKLAAGNGVEPAAGGAIVHLDEVPQLALDSARLLRELTIQEKLFEYLTIQYETARIQEARDTPACQIVQRAERPEKECDLGPVVLLGLGILAGSAAGVLASIWREDVRRGHDV